MVRDEVAIDDERVKLLAGLMNAVCIALAGAGVTAPVVSGLATGSGSASPTFDVALSMGCTGLGLAFHLFAHHVLGRLEKAEP